MNLTGHENSNDVERVCSKSWDNSFDLLEEYLIMTKTKKTTRPKKTVLRSVDTTDVAVTDELTESLISDEERLEMISEAAYYRAEARGFKPGDHVKDWLEAEELVDKMLSESVKEARF